MMTFLKKDFDKSGRWRWRRRDWRVLVFDDQSQVQYPYTFKACSPVPQEEAELNVIDDKRGKDDDGDDVDVDDDDPQGGAELGVTDDEGGSAEEGSEQGWKCPSTSTIPSIQVLSLLARFCR